MPKLFALLIFLMTTGMLVAADADDYYKKYNKSYNSSVNKADKELADAKEMHDKGVLAVTKKYRKALEKILTMYTKEGKLDKALKVREEIETLKKLVDVGKALKAEGAVETSSEHTNYEKSTQRIEPSASDNDIRLVIWNGHNRGDAGVEKVNVYAYRNKKVVWEKKDVELEWKAEGTISTEVFIPKQAIYTIKVEITKSRNNWGALAEIEIWKGRRNYALKSEITSSGSYKPLLSEQKLKDGNKTSHDRGIGGYWMLGSGTGWVQLDRLNIR